MNTKLILLIMFVIISNVNCRPNKGVQELFKNGEYDKVIESCNEALLKNNSVEALHYRGESFQKIGNYKGAFKDFTTLYMMGDTSIETVKGLAYSSLQLEQYVYSRKFFERLIKMDTSNDYNYFCLAILCFKDKKAVEALEYLDFAIRKRPYSVKYLSNKGNILYEMGRFKESVTCFTKIIENRNINDTFYFARGVSYSHMGEYDSSINNISQAISLNKSCARYYYNRAIVYMYKKEKSKACLDLEKAKSLGYTYADIEEEIRNYCE